MQTLDDLQNTLACIQSALEKGWAIKASCDENGFWSLSLPLGERWPSRFAAETFGNFLSDKVEGHLLAQAIGYRAAIKALQQARQAAPSSSD